MQAPDPPPPLSQAVDGLVDVLVVAEDQPGVLAEVFERLDEHGVPLIGFSAFTGGGRALIHLAVTVPEATRRALRDAPVRVASVRPAFALNLPHRPLALHDIGHTLAEHGVNVSLAYLTAAPVVGTRIIVVPEPTDPASG